MNCALKAANPEQVEQQTVLCGVNRVMVMSSESLSVLLSTRSPARGKADGGCAVPTPNRLFGTDGIRGKAGHLLTPALAMQVGFWAGTVLKKEAGHTGPLMIC
jgi:Phosphoglucomutase/phosphomannomutase, alpha/beta/alpha domain I